MKYTICREGEFLANSDGTRKLFDTKEEAEIFKNNNNIDAYVHGYMNQSDMRQVFGINAYNLYKSGTEVYTKIFGLNWSLCKAGSFDFNDFTQGIFDFYIIDK